MDNKLKFKDELEEMILSVMLNDNNSLDLIADKLKDKDFTKFNQDLFNKILELSVKDIPIEIKLLELIKDFGSKRIHELKYKLAQPSIEYLFRYQIIDKLKNASFSLQAEKFLSTKMKDIKNDFSGIETLESLISDIQDLIRTKENYQKEKSFSEKIPSILENFENQILSENEDPFNVSNIPSFNNATNGVIPSNLITIAGFTGQGKTYLGLNIILDLANQKIPVGFFSLEQSESEIQNRLIGILSGIPSFKLRNPKKLNPEELKKIAYPNFSKMDLPIYINDRPLTETEIKSKIKYWRDRFNVKVVCLDYLGLIQSRTKFLTRERELTYYSEFLKLTAKELDVIIVILTQLNRQGKENPTIDNLAESIGLARDSDFLFTIYKPIDAGLKADEEQKIKFDENHFILRCEKNRHNKAKKQILLKMIDSGEFREIGTEYCTETDQIFNSKMIQSN